MSFLEETKEQIINNPTKSVCCKRALLSGILFSKATLSEKGQITLSLSSDSAVEFLKLLIKESFGKDAAVFHSSVGGRRTNITFSSPAAEKYILSLSDEIPSPFVKKCDGCISAFLRGVFLACGRITNPKKQYRLELAPSERFELLNSLLSSQGLVLSVLERRAEKILYTQNSSVIEDFFVALGLNNTVFYLMNLNIENDLKNSVNRIRNCETNNILKTVSAAARPISAIEALIDANLLSTLPEELEKTARLRIQYKDYSLSRLAAEFTPPISKPGLSHRLNKIVEIAENYFGKKENF